MPIRFSAFLLVTLILLAMVPTASLADISAPSAALETRPRLLVLTDIEADPDDTQSLVRLLLYSDVIDLRGLVATTSTWKQTSVAPESIRAVIAAYAKDRPNLLLHRATYPTAEYLESLVSVGRPEYGMKGVGPGKDSSGSTRLVEEMERDDPRPLWVAIWGGANTLAQALHHLRAERPAAEVDRLVRRLRVHAISDQDDAGAWIRAEFPQLFYIVSPGGNYGASTWMAINRVVDGIDNTTLSNRWLAENVQQGFGALGAAYPDVAWGMEGDTPSWLGLIPNGLNTPDRPDWGGWGGRYELYLPDAKAPTKEDLVNGVYLPPETRPIWTNAIDTFQPIKAGAFGRSHRHEGPTFADAGVTLWRWRDDFQNDFAARMTWTIRSLADANHPPIAHLRHADTLAVKSGATFELDAHGSSDPDGDNLSYFWIYYPEAGTFRGALPWEGPRNQIGVAIQAPTVTTTQTLHFILRVTDKGRPSLCSYRRVIVTVDP